MSDEKPLVIYCPNGVARTQSNCNWRICLSALPGETEKVGGFSPVEDDGTSENGPAFDRTSAADGFFEA